MPLQDHMSLADIDISSKLDELPASMRHYLQVIAPHWLHHDLLYQQILAMPMLYRHGRVVWAALVQANSLMFQSRPENCPGEVVYDPSGKTELTTLLEMAQKLYRLKNTTPVQPDQRAYAENLTGEMSRLFAHTFPQSLAPLPLKISGLWFWRPHLPNGMLSLTYFPILLCDDEAFAGQVMPLPSLFWPETLQQYWLQHDMSDEDYTQPATLTRLPKLDEAVPPLSYLFKGAYSSPKQIRLFLDPLQTRQPDTAFNRNGMLIAAVLITLMIGLLIFGQEATQRKCSDFLENQPASMINMVCQKQK